MVSKGDITNLNFRSNSFDTVIVIEVFEYLTEFKKAISEIYRVLKPKGIILVSIPFMYKYHNDSIRFTRTYLLELFSEFSKIQIYPIGNFYTIILDILRDKIIHIKFSLIRYLLYIPYLILALFIIPSKQLIKDTNFVSGYLIFAKK
jgi:ubiquinone/menaquinone biosynthesis C-methylase UbiE